jgi:SSS family solute:Na+ symporter
MTHFTWIDGGIVGVYLLATMIVGILVRRYVSKVEHFLLAGREMNLHLGIASLAATEFGIITCMYAAQNGYEKGFAGAVPGICMAASMFIVGLTGFCVKPLRDAGVVTVPELFERRFGQKIRCASGVVIVLGGLLNMGVFLRTGGEFLLTVCGLEAAQMEGFFRTPAGATLAGILAALSGSEANLVATFITAHSLEILMTILLAAVAAYTILGGMLSVLVTDFLQFVVMSVGLLAVTFLILAKVGWSSLTGAVEYHHSDGGFNPFVHQDMGWEYVLFNALQNFAAVLTWQTTIQRLLAAKDTRTGRRIYLGTSFFFVCRFLIPGIWGMAALALLAPADFHDNTLLAMPHLLATVVPWGLMGLLVAAMLAADMSTDSSYMLGWASVIYNDIIAPLKRRPWSEKKGLIINRSIVSLIGIFLLVYGLWYPMKGNLWDYLTVTGAIYLSSMSVLLVACCYWKRANAWGATGAIAAGAVIPVAFLVLKEIPATSRFANETVGSSWSGIASFVGAALAMIALSFLRDMVRGRSEAVPLGREET